MPVNQAKVLEASKRACFMTNGPLVYETVSGKIYGKPSLIRVDGDIGVGSIRRDG
jgi:hypothetical protein